MVDLRAGNTGSAAIDAADIAELDDAAVVRLLAASDPESVATLEAWLKVNAKTYAPVVELATQREGGLSAEAACAVLDALLRRTTADEETTLRLVTQCLDIIAGRITESLKSGPPSVNGGQDDPLVSQAVAVVTSNRRSRHSETAIACLAQAGPGGALVLARAFDAVRDTSQLYIVRRLQPEDVLVLGDNVVASLAHSVEQLAETLEGRKRTVVLEFLAELGPVHGLESSEIGVDEPLEPGTQVFHARWGAGIVLSANEESATIDFSGAGTRTLLRALTTLRHTA